MDVLPAILLGYAIGSLPIGFLVAQNTRGIDLRRAGSGNVGAANVYRTTGPGIAIAVMVADSAKGAAAVVIAGGGTAAVAAAAFGLMVARTRFVSLGSVVAAVLLPVAGWLTPGLRAVDIAATVVAMLILFRHRGNIARLWSRTERALPSSRAALRRTSGT